MNLRKFFLYTLIVSVVVSALLAIGVILFGDFGELETRIILTSLTIACTSILGLACGAYYEARGGRVLPLAGIAFSFISAVISVIIIWGSGPSTPIAKTGMSTTLLATACAHLSLILLARLDARFRWTFYLAFLADWTLVAILLVIIWFEPDPDTALISRLIGVLSIVIAALTVMTPVFHKLSRQPEAGTEDIDAEIARLRARIEELERQKTTRN